MKCPKCGYLGFEQVDRCRNCGYDFSFNSPPSAAAPDLALRTEADTMRPLEDLSLVDAALVSSRARRRPAPDLDRIFGGPEPASSEPPSVAPSRHQELPLFGPPIPDDEPLITKASPPRQPLAVRRATPEIARLRAEQPRAASLDLTLDPDPARTLDTEPKRRALPPRRVEEHAHTGVEAGPDAGIGARLLAVAIDLIILAAIDVIVIYFTMQICAIGVDDFGLLPKGPLIAFLLVQNGGYLVAFTAGGQTLGKMAAGIRVVPDAEHESLDLGHAFLRTSMWVVLAVPAGLGFVTALFSPDRRGLHDRFAGTRVVRG